MIRRKLIEYLGWNLIAAGVGLFGILTYRSLISSPLPNSDLPALLKPIETEDKDTDKPSKISHLKQYLEGKSAQLMEGFSTITLPGFSGIRPSWQDSVKSWWTIANNPSKELEWQSGVCLEKKKTALIFSGVLGLDKGEALIIVNDLPALNFTLGPGTEKEEWTGNDFIMSFFAIKINPNGERFGIFCLTVPKEQVTAGEAITIGVKIVKSNGSGKCYFMLSNLPDIIPELMLK
jgi:hypothetical protein